VATAEPGRFPVALDDAWRALGDVVTGVYSTTGCLRALLEKLAQHCGHADILREQLINE